MKTDKWKVIVIKDPRLRRARKSFRTLLRLAYLTEKERLRQLQDLYRQMDIKGRKLTPSQRRREIMLSRLKDELSSAYSSSILWCSMGSLCESSKKKNIPTHEVSLDVDMAWNPVDKRWCCSACYNYHFGTKDAQLYYRRGIEKMRAKDKALDDYLTEKFGLDRQLTEEEGRVLDEFIKEYDDFEQELKKVKDIEMRKALIEKFLAKGNIIN